MDNKKNKEQEQPQMNVQDGGVTQAQIDAWKREHGKLVEITVVDGDTEHKGYFHRPSMETMSAVNKLAKNDEVKSTVTMFDNCWLGGSPEMKTDALVKMAAIGQLATMFQSCIGSLKNL